MHQSLSKNFQPGTAAKQRTKADEMLVSPAIANALVVSIPVFEKEDFI